MLIAVLVVGGACSGEDEPDRPGASASAAVPPGDSIKGIVTSVESSGLNEVSSFRVKTQGDTEYEVLIDPDLNYGFPLGHREEHRVSADPVEVAFDVRDGAVYASSIDDV